MREGVFYLFHNLNTFLWVYFKDTQKNSMNLNSLFLT